MDGIIGFFPVLMYLFIAYLIYTFIRDYGFGKGLAYFVGAIIICIVELVYLSLMVIDIPLPLIVAIIIPVCTYFFMKSNFFATVNGRIYRSYFTRSWLIHSALNTLYFPVAASYYVIRYLQIRRSDGQTAEH